MNPVLEITQAIGILAGMRRNSTPGPWVATDGPDWCKEIRTAEKDLATAAIATGLWDSSVNDDAQLIAVLHATIDAQIAILREGIDVDTDGRQFETYRTSEVPILDLARAINGAA